MPSSLRIAVEKIQTINDGRLFFPLPKVNGTDEKNRRVEFYFK